NGDCQTEGIFLFKRQIPIYRSNCKNGKGPVPLLQRNRADKTAPGIPRAVLKEPKGEEPGRFAKCCTNRKKRV
ncbi:MAG: hypothetical protein ACI4PO_10385, partial [Faecousia sp.]